MIIHIKATQDVDNKVLSELMNVLNKDGFRTEKYLSMAYTIVMAKKEELLA